MTTKVSTQVYSANHNIFIPSNASPKNPPNDDSWTDTDDLECMLSNNLPVISEEVNTVVGTTSDCMKALFSSKVLQETRQQINEDMTKGKTITKKLMKAAYITASNWERWDKSINWENE